MVKKIVVVGDGECGKNSLLIAFRDDKFSEEYAPTVCDNYRASIDVDGKSIDLHLWGTSGQEAYDYIRQLCYTKTDVFLLCFSIDWPESLRDVSERWLPEVKHHCPNVPIILIGNKKDLRRGNNSEQIDEKEGQAMAEKMGAVRYLECSAKTREGVKEVFKEAARTAQTRKPVRKKCHVLYCCRLCVNNCVQQLDV